MSRSNIIDERVVEMKFDNKQFESNIKESMSSVDKFKKSLDFSKTTSGISAFEVAAITAIANISNRITDLGLNILKSLTVDNIAAGWQKYNEEVKATGTLMSQGIAGESTITKQLEVLQFFADETSYSFDSMYDSVTKFTASGVGLEDSVTAVEGIAIWAAKAGQNSEVASRAMYQLSQAVSAGTVRLQDYRSIQTANMDTQEFRNTVLETAAAMGELYENLEGKYITKAGTVFDAEKGFTESLSQGWFSRDVLLKALAKYSGSVTEVYEYIENQADMGVSVTASDAIDILSDSLDEFSITGFKAAQEARTLRDAIDSVKEATASGWKKIFKNIFGDYEESKKLWTAFANELWDVFVEPLNNVSEILKSWKSLGGIDDLFKRAEDGSGAFWNLFDAIIAIKNAVADAWRQIFPIKNLKEGENSTEAIARNLKQITENINNFTKKLILNEKNAKSLTNVLKGFFSILKVIKDLISSIVIIIKPIVSAFLDLFGELFYGATEFVGYLSDIISKSTFLRDVAEKIAKAINTVTGSIKRLFKKVDSDDIEDVSDKVEVADKTIERINKTIDKTKEIVKDTKETVIETVEEISEETEGFWGFINLKLIPAFERMTKYIKDRMWPEIETVFSGIWNWLSNKIWPLLEKIWPIIKRIAVGIGNVISNVLLPNLIELLDLISQVIEPLLSGALNLLTNIGKAFLNTLKRFGPIFDKFGTAISILFDAFINSLDRFADNLIDISKKIRDGNWDDESVKSALNFLKWAGIIVAGVLAITKVRDILDGFRATFTPVSYFLGNLGDFLWSLGQGIKFAAIGYIIKSLADLGLAIAALAVLGPDTLTQGGKVLVGVISAIAAVLVALEILHGTNGGTGTLRGDIGPAALILSVSALIGSISRLALSIIALGSFDTATLLKGGITVGALIVVVSLVAGLLGWLLGKGKLGGTGSSRAMGLSFGLKKGFDFSSSRNTSLVQDALGNITRISLAIFVLALTLGIIAMIDENKIWKAYGVLSALAGILFAFEIVISLINRGAKNNGAAGSAIRSTFSLALSLLILAGVIALFANMPENVFTDGAKRMGMIAAGLLIFVSVLSIINIFAKYEKTTAKTIRSTFALSLSLLVLVGVLAILNALDPTKTNESMKQLGIMMVGILAFLAGLAWLGKYMATEENTIIRMRKMLWTIMIVVIEIVSLALVAIALKYVEWDELGKLGSIALGALVSLLALAEIGKLIEKVSFKSLIVGLISLAAFVAVIAELGWALSVALPSLKEMGENKDTIMKGLGALGLLLGELFAVAALFGVVTGVTKGVGALFGAAGLVLLAALIAVIAELGWALSSSGGLANTLKDFGDRKVGEGITNLGFLIDTLAKASVKGLSVVGQAFQALSIALYGWSLNVLSKGMSELANASNVITSINFTNADYTSAVLMADTIHAISSRFNVINTLLKAFSISLFASSISDLVKIFDEFTSLEIDNSDIETAKNLINLVGMMNDIVEMLDEKRNIWERVGTGIVEYLFGNLFGTDKFETAKDNLKKLGEGFNSFLSGINANKAKDVADILKPFSNFVDLASSNPKEITDRYSSIGRAMLEGMVKGLRTSEVSMLAQFRNFFANLFVQIQSIIDGLDQPVMTIRPVFDMSEIQNGLGQIYKAPFQMTGSNDIANRTASEMQSFTTLKQSNITTKGTETPGNVITNTFNISGTNAKEIADEVSLRLQQQINRRNAKWGA